MKSLKTILQGQLDKIIPETVLYSIQHLSNEIANRSVESSVGP